MKNPRQLLDAVKTADDIRKGDFSSLHGKSFVVCVNMEKNRRGGHVKKPTGERMTLAKLAKQMNSRFDNLEKDVNSLKQDVKDINTRLDYIVKANNLKDNK